jgi:hypothetical protein
MKIPKSIWVFQKIYAVWRSRPPSPRGDLLFVLLAIVWGKNRTASTLSFFRPARVLHPQSNTRALFVPLGTASALP